jgi:NIMA (never in mitosis gene a)-related kinase
VFENSRFKEELLWKIAYDLLKGCEIMHKNKIIHRDIKAANVFIVDGVSKHGDLNVSKVMEGKFATTQTGTPYYTAPEIWSGKKYDFKCDIWSLGCLLYELCQLRPPFQAKDFPGLSKKVLAGYYDPISSSYSKKLSQLIRNCLTVDQTRRPTAQELLMQETFMEMENGKDG